MRKPNLGLPTPGGPSPYKERVEKPLEPLSPRSSPGRALVARSVRRADGGPGTNRGNPFPSGKKFREFALEVSEEEIIVCGKKALRRRTYKIPEQRRPERPDSAAPDDTRPHGRERSARPLGKGSSAARVKLALFPPPSSTAGQCSYPTSPKPDQAG
jgi:hypothetical protein